MKRLAIITTHPIQYNAPLFKLLSERKQIEIKVFYTWSQSQDEVYDARFGMKRSWDIPLLEGYSFEFIENTAKHADSNRFFGVINPNLVLALKAYQPSAVLVYRWSVFSHFKLMQLMGGNPLLYFRGDSHLGNKEKGIKNILKTIFLKFVYRNVDKAFYVGAYNKAYYLKYGLSENQLVLAPHAVDNNRFADNLKTRELAAAERKTLGIPDTAIVFLYAGKFYGLKQLDLLIQAFLKIKGEHYRLLLYGTGEQEAALRSLAKSDDRIIFCPFKNQSEMPIVYRVGDVFVLPSKSETWGLAVNEAMASSRPAIVSDQCGCAPDLIIEGITGFTFRNGDIESLLQCMQQFTNRADVIQMGKKAFQHIELFSLERVASQIEEELNL